MSTRTARRPAPRSIHAPDPHPIWPRRAAAPPTRPRSAHGFSLIEVLMAVAISLVVSSIAVQSFIATQKYLYRIETLAGKTLIYQSMILYSLTQTSADHEFGPEFFYDFPYGGHIHHIGGCVRRTSDSSGLGVVGKPDFFICDLQDWTNVDFIKYTTGTHSGAGPVTLPQSSSIYIPMIGD